MRYFYSWFYLNKLIYFSFKQNFLIKVLIENLVLFGLYNYIWFYTKKFVYNNFISIANFSYLY